MLSNRSHIKPLHNAALVLTTAFVAALMLGTTPVLASGYDDDHHEYSHKRDKHENRAVSKMFKRLDDNDDGVVSLDEYLYMTNEIIERMDDDENGEISAKEWPSRKRHRWALSMMGLDTRDELPIATSDIVARATAQFNAADSDANGTLTRTEYQQGRKMQMFERMDTDGDGTISTDEFLNHRRR